MTTSGQIFTTPEIRSSGARWYVEYKLNGARRREYGQVNRIKDEGMRMRALEKLKNEIMQGLMSAESKTAQKPTRLWAALSEILHHKKLYTKKNTWRSYQTAATLFSDFVNEEWPGIKVADITHEHVRLFLADCLQKKCSARTRNNYLKSLNGIFNALLDREIIFKNPCTKIEMLPARSETHVAFTDAQVSDIKRWLQKHDPYTLFFCQFITYTFLRPCEIITLKVGNIDFAASKLVITAADSKTKRMVKNIPKRFLNILKAHKLHKADPKYYIFTLSGRPGDVRVGANFFQKRFKKLKDDLKFSPLHTMYGLRHSYVSQMVRNGAKWHEVMQLTGHTTMAAFSNYMRSLGLIEAKDLSQFISVKF